MNNNTMKKIWAALTLLAITTGNVKAGDELDNIRKNIHETYQEWGNPEYKDFLKEEFNKLPKYILDFIKENPFHIVIMEDEHQAEQVYQKIYDLEIKEGYELFGITIPNLTTSFIEGSKHTDFYKKYNYHKELSEEEYNKLIIRFTMLHEIGHLFDINYYLSEQEYFATIFASYLLYPEDLLKNCPISYSYMENYLKELNNVKTYKK